MLIASTDRNIIIMAQNIAVLGSTGSIGTQTLDIIDEYPDRFRVSLLTAGSNWELLARQSLRFHPEMAVIADDSHYTEFKEMLRGSGVKTACGSEAIARAVAESEADTVVTAMVGYSGLIPTVNAIKSGKNIALANKETLVVAGHIIDTLAKKHGISILPVDSEHSAIFQCLQGEDRQKMRKIILTASGGPFRNLSREQLDNVTVADALRHPNWEMGAKVTIDSASMMNKGFEMIEARWLFGCIPENIEIVIHPQSIVHSMVEFADGSVKAQLGVPDMHLPIRYALGYPERLATRQSPLRLSQYKELTFEAPDYGKFPLLSMAFEAIRQGGNAPCVLSAANERAVAAFLGGRIRFTDMPLVAERTLATAEFIPYPDLDTLVISNREASCIADEVIRKTAQ